MPDVKFAALNLARAIAAAIAATLIYNALLR
jgi:hypothetical protein